MEEKSPDGTPRITNITIFLDPRRDGTVRLVIHELLHVYMLIHLRLSARMVYDLEEVAILAWEKELYLYLHKAKNERLLESWSKAIERKMA